MPGQAWKRRHAYAALDATYDLLRIERPCALHLLGELPRRAVWRPAPGAQL